ncbi:hypothetical protein I5M32_06550 [Pedobacter sp. SD-b]|uniref:Uncharacterized protein n=1 Tax=Pedobacter segetis TaxID=2793069 RepID=A0ABS1BIC7_9SPHI|nr:hypothetical protein [Pedobacter segetis]MBK0382619.1 hypothetical protein [Pedobacter segetis]
MKDFDSLVGIWNEQKTAPQVDHQKIIDQYKKSREKLSLKFWKEILLMLPAFLIVVYLWFTFSFDFWTSYLGLIMVAACSIYFIVVQIINLKNIADSNTLFDKPKDHIQFIQKFRKSRYIQHTRNYKIYTLFLGLGISIYFIEFFYTLNVWLMIGVVGATIAWFAVCYLYLMKIYINKEEKKFTEMIDDLERLNNQFKDEA